MGPLQRRTLRFREAEKFGPGHTAVVVGPELVAAPPPPATAVLSTPSAWDVGAGAPCRSCFHVVGQVTGGQSSCCSRGLLLGACSSREEGMGWDQRPLCFFSFLPISPQQE